MIIELIFTKVLVIHNQIPQRFLKLKGMRVIVEDLNV